MADVKISQLPAATTPVVGTEVLPIVQSGTTAQVSINAATGITRPFTANGVMYASSTSALATGSALTFDGTNFATTGSVTSAGSSNSGNLTFTGTGNRITGDFSNATAASRVAFQSSTTNGNTQIAVFPNGTATNAALDLYSNSDPTNTSRGLIRIDTAGGDFKIDSTRTGTGTYLPLNFLTAGVSRIYVDTSGNVGIGGTANASAILDAQSTTKGVRMPNMTTTQKNAISSPAAGLIVFDTTLSKLAVYSGSAWQTVTSV
jgi:hypothetical protein